MKELQSFIFKFHQLWEAGITAHLDLDTHAGQAWVGLRVQLGQAQDDPAHQRQPTPHRTPAYHRRQERRKAARAASSTTLSKSNAAEEAVVISKKANDATEKVVIESANKNGEQWIENIENAEEVEIVDIVESAEQVIDVKNAEKAFSCDFCEKSFATEKGLKTHEGKQHKASCGSPIPQMDGVNDLEYLKYAFKSDYGKEDIEDSLNIIQEKTKVKVELVSRVRMSERSAEHDCIVRVGPCDLHDFSWPDLNQEDAVVFTNLQKLYS